MGRVSVAVLFGIAIAAVWPTSGRAQVMARARAAASARPLVMGEEANALASPALVPPPPPGERSSLRRWVVTGASFGALAGFAYGAYRGYHDAVDPTLRPLMVPLGAALFTIPGAVVGGATGFLAWRVASPDG